MDSPNPYLELLFFKSIPNHRHFHNHGLVQYSTDLLAPKLAGKFIGVYLFAFVEDWVETTAGVGLGVVDGGVEGVA